MSKCPEYPQYDDCRECEAYYQPCHPRHNKHERESKKCLHCDYMRRPIEKEVPAHGMIETWEYCPTHGVYSDWNTELPEYMTRRAIQFLKSILKGARKK